MNKENKTEVDESIQTTPADGTRNKSKKEDVKLRQVSLQDTPRSSNSALKNVFKIPSTRTAAGKNYN